MRPKRHFRILPLALCAVLVAAAPAAAQVLVQCPGDVNGDAVPDPYFFKNNGQPDTNNPNPDFDPDVTCMHLTAGDGFATMADGRVQYIFGFADVTGVGDCTLAQPDGSIDKIPGCKADGDISDDVLAAGQLAHAWPAPAVAINQGKKFYLGLTNVGMLMRPDLFDPHTVHFHGYPQSSTVFDGLPESGISINMGATLTYFYDLVAPGTFMYHCHVEATEHMQMGMLGNLYVRATQSWDGDPLNGVVAGNLAECDAPGDQFPGIPCGYTYNDGDGSTAYDLEFPLQLAMFDPEFHDASWFVQPLPFAMMWDRYPMMNGRGYPDTVNPNPLPTPTDPVNCDGPCNGGVESQVESSLIVAAQGEQILLRLSNINITVVHTLISPSIPMKVVGIDASELVAADGSKLHYTTNSVTMGGGMSADVILDTAGIAPGTYFLYTTNLHHLSNYDQDFGGMLTEIVVQ